LLHCDVRGTLAATNTGAVVSRTVTTCAAVALLRRHRSPSRSA